MADDNSGLNKLNREKLLLVLPWVLFGLSLILIFIFTIDWKKKLFNIPDIEKLNSTKIDQAVVVEKIQKVAKLVTTEVTLRDVINYENTWYGSTKRSLVVITGRVAAGVNLDAGTAVNINDQAKKITITLPEPTILSTEVTDIKTYDENSGYWNAFTPEDKDKIFRLGRDKITNTARELSLTKNAQQNLTELLNNMFNVNGYTVEVIYKQPTLLRN